MQTKKVILSTFKILNSQLLRHLQAAHFSIQQPKQQQKPKEQPKPQAPLRDYSQIKLFDIAANLSDDRYKGVYYGGKLHDPDFDLVIKRANDYGVRKFLFASGYLHDAEDSYNLALRSEDFYCTVGVHPCRATEPFKVQSQNSSSNSNDEVVKSTSLTDSNQTVNNKLIDQQVKLPNEEEKDNTTQRQEINKEEMLKDYMRRIDEMLCTKERKEKFVAIGECGLDYDRFEYADKETQLMVFPPHFDLAQKHNLPMYLHSRNTDGDFARIVRENRHKFSTGVVHSYTGDLEELRELLDMNLYIGLNGCSLKTDQNMEVVKQIPLDRIMLETDCPYCDIRNSHASAKHVKTQFAKVPKDKYKCGDKMNKDRNEPCTMIQVAEVVSHLLGVSEEELMQVAWENTVNMFNLKE